MSACTSIPPMPRTLSMASRWLALCIRPGETSQWDRRERLNKVNEGAYEKGAERPKAKKKAPRNWVRCTFWSLTLVPLLKYVIIVLGAAHNDEGMQSLACFNKERMMSYLHTTQIGHVRPRNQLRLLPLAQHLKRIHRKISASLFAIATT